MSRNPAGRDDGGAHCLPGQRQGRECLAEAHGVGKQCTAQLVEQRANLANRIELVGPECDAAELGCGRKCPRRSAVWIAPRQHSAMTARTTSSDAKWSVTGPTSSTAARDAGSSP